MHPPEHEDRGRDRHGEIAYGEHRREDQEHRRRGRPARSEIDRDERPREQPDAGEHAHREHGRGEKVEPHLAPELTALLLRARRLLEEQLRQGIVEQLERQDCHPLSHRKEAHDGWSVEELQEKRHDIERECGNDRAGNINRDLSPVLPEHHLHLAEPCRLQRQGPPDAETEQRCLACQAHAEAGDQRARGAPDERQQDLHEHGDAGAGDHGRGSDAVELVPQEEQGAGVAIAGQEYRDAEQQSQRQRVGVAGRPPIESDQYGCGDTTSGAERVGQPQDREPAIFGCRRHCQFEPAARERARDGSGGDERDHGRRCSAAVARVVQCGDDRDAAKTWIPASRNLGHLHPPTRTHMAIANEPS